MAKTKLYAVGSYGTGNLGDDAIFNGLHNIYDGQDIEVVQVFSLYPTHDPSIHVKDLRDRGFPRDSRLLIGGGSLFFDRTFTHDLIAIVDQARKAEVRPIEVQRAGLEAVPAELYPQITELLRWTDLITARSTESQRILKTLGFNVRVEPDFAYHINMDSVAARGIFPSFHQDLPVVGLVTAGSSDTAFVASYVSLLTTHCNVLHIPHARHYDDPHNNEVATGELIWSNISIYGGSKLERYKCLPYPETPEMLLGIYSLLDMVIGYRFHSFIFAEMAGTPLFGMPHGGKALSYFAEHPAIPHSDGTETREQLIVELLDYIADEVLSNV